ncbi:glycosyltransferase family 10 domain-containing protein [Viscerimonas tarda]
MAKEPYKVKFTPYRKNLGEIMLRQTPGGKGFSSDGRYRFYTGEEIDEPDFWVIHGKGLRQAESCKVAPQNTLMLTTEPRSVLNYPQKYVRQFGLVCSCQQQLKHPNVVLAPPVLPWFVGFSEAADGTCSYSLDYDNLHQSPAPQKTKLISVITSNKAFTQGHLDRIRFVEKLKMHYGDKIDVFGRGYRNFDDKWDVLAPYKYHIAIENSSQPYYWTEKISDCFLAETFPFYYGCTNLSDYFPAEACQEIDIFNFEHTVEIIDRLLATNAYDNRKAILSDCKQLTLGEYNMFDYIATLCDRLDASLPKENVTLHPCRTMQDWHNFYNYTFARNLFKWKQKIKTAFGSPSPLTRQV